MIAVKKQLHCVKCGKQTRYGYFTDAWTTGDLANIFNEDGRWIGDMSNNVEICSKC